jgi:hypothetical protein
MRCEKSEMNQSIKIRNWFWVLFITAWALYAASFLMPSVAVTSTRVVEGYLCAYFAVMMSFDSSEQFELVGRIACLLGTMTNLIFISSPFILFTWPKPLKLLALAVFCSAIWVWSIPPLIQGYEDFRIGYYVWSISQSLLFCAVLMRIIQSRSEPGGNRRRS